MKSIENKKTALPDAADYKALITHIVNTPPSGGLTAADMRQRIRILDAIAASTAEEIKLEDADHAVLVECTRTMHWGIVHRDLVALEDAIINARTL